MEEAPAIVDSFEERRKIFKDIWDNSDAYDPAENCHKPRVIKTARMSNDVVVIKKKPVKKFKSVCKKVLKQSDGKKNIQEEATSIGTRNSIESKPKHVMRKRKIVKKVKSSSSCKSCSKNLPLINEVTSEGKSDCDNTPSSVPVVVQKEDIKENTKKFIKPAKVDGKRLKLPVRFYLKQQDQVQRVLANLTRINLCI